MGIIVYITMELLISSIISIRIKWLFKYVLENNQLHPNCKNPVLLVLYYWLKKVFIYWEKSKTRKSDQARLWYFIVFIHLIYSIIFFPSCSFQASCLRKIFERKNMSQWKIHRRFLFFCIDIGFCLFLLGLCA